MVKKISLIYESERFFDVCNENLIISIVFTSAFMIPLHRKPITRRKFSFGNKDMRNKIFQRAQKGDILKYRTV